jgi:hypothetical protein
LPDPALRDRFYGVIAPSHSLPLLMDKTHQHRQSPGDRGATSHIRRLTTHMNRSERLAIALLLVQLCLHEADKSTTDFMYIENIGVTGGHVFNEKLDDIRLLCARLPTRYLAELAVAILLPEVSFAPTPS